MIKDEEISEEDSIKSLKKDDDDSMEFETFNPIKTINTKNGSSSTEKEKKKGKISLDDSRHSNPMPGLYRKRNRSESSSSSENSIKAYLNNKKKKVELSEFQKSYIKSQKEEFEKNYRILQEDFKILEEYEKKIFKDTNLDLMFIMDLTGSMGIWLEEAQKSINGIIEEITDNNPGSKIRISFVGYRDYQEQDEQRQYFSKEFTENINEITEYIKNLDCTGGGDLPEDIVGALETALNMKWESRAKYAILVCDAPCHGKKYHNISYDRFENGDPRGVTLEDVMKQFYQRDITFYCLEIDESTEKMFEIMKSEYNDQNKFHIEKMDNSVQQFRFFVAFSASVLLNNSKYNTYPFNYVINNYRKEFIEKIIQKYKDNIPFNNQNDNNTLDLINQIENLQLGGEEKKLFDFINRMNDLNIGNQGITNNDLNNYINIVLNEESLKEFNEKEINYNIKSIDYNKNLNIVNDWVNPSITEKEFKSQLVILYNNIKKDEQNSQYELKIYDQRLNREKKGIIPFRIEKEYYFNPSLFIKKLAYNDLICEQIADYYNIMIMNKLPQIRQYIKFEKHILYELQTNDNLDFYNNNKFIISEDSTKFSSDNINPMDNRALQAFTHFSYQISGGQLYINILNYDKISKKVKDYQIHFLRDNSYKYILEFFASHTCDKICKSLGLSHPRKKANPIQVTEDFYSFKYLTDIKLCKCCSKPLYYMDNIKNLICSECSYKENSSKYKEICSICKEDFLYSKYVYNCKLTDYPIKCPKCNPEF